MSVDIFLRTLKQTLLDSASYFHVLFWIFSFFVELWVFSLRLKMANFFWFTTIITSPFLVKYIGIKDSNNSEMTNNLDQNFFITYPLIITMELFQGKGNGWIELGRTNDWEVRLRDREKWKWKSVLGDCHRRKRKLVNYNFFFTLD